MIARVSAITANTLTDLVRQKVFYFLLIFALIVIGSSIALARFTFQQEFQILKDISLGAMSIVTSLLAILATARLIPKDIEDRTIYTILAKPVPRFEYVLGRLFGVLVLLGVSMVVMSALFLIVLYSREQDAISETMRQLAHAPRDQLNDALRAVHMSALNMNLFPGILIIYLKACLLAAVTLFVSTLATTNIFTVVVMGFVYIIGHFEAIAHEYWLEQHGASWLAHAFLGLVALIFPDLQAFNLVDDVVAGAVIGFGLFFKTALLAFFYTTIYTLLAILTFWGKEL